MKPPPNLRPEPGGAADIRWRNDWRRLPGAFPGVIPVRDRACAAPQMAGGLGARVSSSAAPASIASGGCSGMYAVCMSTNGPSVSSAPISAQPALSVSIKSHSAVPMDNCEIVDSPAALSQRNCRRSPSRATKAQCHAGRQWRFRDFAVLQVRVFLFQPARPGQMGGNSEGSQRLEGYLAPGPRSQENDFAENGKMAKPHRRANRQRRAHCGH